MAEYTVKEAAAILNRSIFLIYRYCARVKKFRLKGKERLFLTDEDLLFIHRRKGKVGKRGKHNEYGKIEEPRKRYYT